ncbi:MAG TPA: hypothetical protein VGF79_00935 [Bacteroidia bacterium]
MKTTIRYTKGKEDSTQVIEEKNYYKVKRLLEAQGYKVEKV